MDEKTLFLTADKALNNVVQQIRDDQWDMVLPKEFRSWSAPGKDLSLRELINYHAYDEAWVPDTLSGKPMKEVGIDTHKGDLLGDDPKATYGALVDVATAAVEGLSDEDLDKTVHLSYGPFPTRDYLQHISLFRGMRSHDIAKLIGVDYAMPPELVQGLWDMLENHAEEWREMGVFGPMVNVPEDASLQNRLLGLTGRQPD